MGTEKSNPREYAIRNTCAKIQCFVSRSVTPNSMLLNELPQQEVKMEARL